MRFERTLDAERVLAVLAHPRLYRWLADDFYGSAENFWPPMGETIYHLLCYDGEELLGLFSCNLVNRILWEVHVFLLPCAWGRRARRAAKEFFAWVWANLPAQTLFGLIAEDNRAALDFAQRCGMQHCGRLCNSLRRGGALHDLLIYSLEKD